MLYKLRKISKLSRPPIYMIGVLSLFTIFSISVKFIVGITYSFFLKNIDRVSVNEIVKGLIFTVIIIIIGGFSNYAYRTYSAIHTEKIHFKLKNQEISRYLSSYSDNTSQNKDNFGSWLTILQQDLLNISRFFTGAWLQFVLGILCFLVAIIISMFISYKMTLVIILSSLISVFISKITEKKIQQGFFLALEKKEEVSNIIIRLLSQIDLIKSYKITRFILKKVNILVKQQQEKNMELKSRQALMIALQSGGGFVCSSFWLIYGGILVWNKGLDLGAFMFFIGAYDLLNWPFFKATALWSLCIEAKVSYDRLEDKKSSYVNIINKIEESSNNLEKDCLVMKDVSFRYFKNTKDVVKDFSLKIHKKEQIVITGESGSGKSTIFKLITSDLQNQTGDIYVLVNGKKYFGSEMWPYISILPQSQILFCGTISENIALENNDNIDLARIHKICQTVKVENVINRLGKGIVLLLLMKSSILYQVVK